MGVFESYMITREADYAIRTVLSLARRQEEGDAAPASTAALADEMQIPFRFLRKIVRKLVAAGMVASQRGNGGGISLVKPAGKLSLLEVLLAVDSKDLQLNHCLVDTNICGRSGFCRVHTQMQRLQTLLEGQLQGITIDQLTDPPR